MYLIEMHVGFLTVITKYFYVPHPFKWKPYSWDFGISSTFVQKCFFSHVSLMPDLNFEITDLLEGVYKTDEHIIKILQFMCIHCDTLRAVSSVCVLFTVFFLILLHT